METFAPLINLLVLLSVLSVTAERVTNTFKLRRPAIRTPETDPAREKERERQITQASLVVCILVAFVVKADLFEILAHLDAPWETIGWVLVDGSHWMPSDATSSWSRFLYALAGSALTGIAMGFGSKFWHDVLDIVFNARENLKALRQRAHPRPDA
jgi:hypothetical protein